MNEEKTVNGDELKNAEYEILDAEKPEEKTIPDPVTAPKFLIKYTLDGEVLVEKDGDHHKEFPLKTVNLLPLPAAIKEEHVIELKLFHSLLLTIRKQYPNRLVPVTRREFMRSGGNMGLIKNLLAWGYLKEAIIPLLSSSGKNPGSRSCMYYTPQGRALIRAKLDAEYAKTDYQ